MAGLGLARNRLSYPQNFGLVTLHASGARSQSHLSTGFLEKSSLVARASGYHQKTKTKTKKKKGSCLFCAAARVSRLNGPQGATGRGEGRVVWPGIGGGGQVSSSLQ